MPQNRTRSDGHDSIRRRVKRQHFMNVLRTRWRRASCLLPRHSLAPNRLAHIAMATAATVNKATHPFDKARLDALLNRRFFYAPAFEIYGGEHREEILDRSALQKAWKFIPDYVDNSFLAQVWRVSMTMVLQVLHFRPISSTNGGNISLSKSICSSWIPLL